MARIVLVDDHQMVRSALNDLLSAQIDLEVVGQASTTEEASKILKAAQVDVIVLDLVLPNQGGKEYALHLLEYHPRLGVLIVSSRLEPAEVFSLVEAGIHGYVTKSSPADEFVRAVRTVALGQHYFSPDVASALAAAMRRGSERASRLTPRQTAILERMARGLTTNDIARDLCLSPKTVEKYRSQILRRLECKNGVQAIQVARRQNLIEESPQSGDA